LKLPKELNRCFYKGAGYWKAALNASLTSIISEYLAERNDDHQALFLNSQNRPIRKLRGLKGSRPLLAIYDRFG